MSLRAVRVSFRQTNFLSVFHNKITGGKLAMNIDCKANKELNFTPVKS